MTTPTTTNWRAIPDETETLPDGTRREWACRDLVPVVEPIRERVEVELIDSDPPNRPGHGYRQRRRNSDLGVDGGGAVAQLRIDNERAGREFERNTVTTAKRLGIWQWVVLVFGLGSIGWGAWVSIRAGAGEYPQTQPSRNAVGKSERDPRDSRAVGGGGRGVNHSRALLMEWLRIGVIGSMTDDEIAAAREAVEADR